MGECVEHPLREKDYSGKSAHKSDDSLVVNEEFYTIYDYCYLRRPILAVIHHYVGGRI